MGSQKRKSMRSAGSVAESGQSRRIHAETPQALTLLRIDHASNAFALASMVDVTLI
jgi:hypothetical protein